MIDNVLITYELLHSIRNRRRGNIRWMITKLESKTYDRVEWSFLETVIRKEDGL